MADIERAPVRADRQYLRPSGSRHIGLPREPSGVGINREYGDLVLVLQADIQRIWHLILPWGFRLGRYIFALYNNALITNTPALQSDPGEA